jgi:predicted dehydrogenase
MGHLWFNKRQPGETDADYLVRNWVSFTEMSGDHIVEQHFHNIDVANWFLGKTPKLCVGFGGRARRKTGNQFDFFSVDFDYGDGIHIHSMCRQVDSCYNRVAEFFTGTQGTTAGSGPVKPSDGRTLDLPDLKLHENPYVQEHIDLLKSIRDGKPLQDAQWAAETNLTAIMGRISAYTGQMVRWQDLTDPQSKSPWYNLTLSPTAEDFEKGTVKAPADDVIPIPGTAPQNA